MYVDDVGGGASVSHLVLFVEVARRGVDQVVVLVAAPPLGLCPEAALCSLPVARSLLGRHTLPAKDFFTATTCHLFCSDQLHPTVCWGHDLSG